MSFIGEFPQKTRKYIFKLAVHLKIWFPKKKTKYMKNRNFLKECKCKHCQQKLEQINSSRLYWDKLILSKN